jgi:hypothetical protein
MDGALGAAGTSAAAIGMDKLGNVGVLYEGLSVMGGGAILSGLVLAAIGVTPSTAQTPVSASGSTRQNDADLSKFTGL